MFVRSERESEGPYLSMIKVIRHHPVHSSSGALSLSLPDSILLLFSHPSLLPSSSSSLSIYQPAYNRERQLGGGPGSPFQFSFFFFFLSSINFINLSKSIRVLLQYSHKPTVCYTLYLHVLLSLHFFPSLSPPPPLSPSPSHEYPISPLLEPVILFCAPIVNTLLHQAHDITLRPRKH